MFEEKDINIRTGLEIAVIGMAARFPGAQNIYEFWDNLRNGVESISFFSDQELEEAGVNKELLKNSHYIKANGYLENKEIFDASFFGYTPTEAELMDPQIRIFHECVFEALEDAGYNPESYDGKIGLYAGGANSFYWQAMSHLSGKNENYGGFASTQLTNKDFLCSRVAYNLNLKGASSHIQTACSTSLVAVHHACRALLTGESEMVLAGGISITSTSKHGYLYQEGMIESEDGHCRAFDAKASGTVGGEGGGIVVLKRLKPALEDRDHIYAIIKGTAINNDGRRKVGFTAPSIEGQAEVIRTAQRIARVAPETITYIEAHGTGTTLGDPVEIEALKLAFNTESRNYCGIGSVKTNIGHLDTAAGIAGFIKTVLSLKHKLIPPSLYFEEPNPKIDFKNSPFYVNTSLKKWENHEYPLRAGVSSFGIGGTNSHVVLEESRLDVREGEQSSSDRKKLFLLSAKTIWSLDKATEQLGEHLKKNPGINLDDVAYTLKVGRKAFQQRRIIMCTDWHDAIELLSPPFSSKMKTFSLNNEKEKQIIYMFPGQGSQYANMGKQLYEKEQVFRSEMDRCFDILKPLMPYNIDEILLPSHGIAVETGSLADINNTEIAQPLLFVFEYSLARLLSKWGVKPNGMIGHSIGEYVAACLAGVFSLEDALKLVVSRGRLMREMPKGAMLSISINEEKLIPLLKNYVDISLAAVNSPSNCVISGPFESIDAIEKEIIRKGYDLSKLHTSHAFHSFMMEPILEQFEACVKEVSLDIPRIPYISNLTGKWITPEDATDPRYWSKHLRNTVRFANGIKEILKKGRCIFIEIGAGKSLSNLVKQNQNKENQCVSLVRHPKEDIADDEYLMNAMGQLWLYGKSIDWMKFYEGEKRYRVSLPTYPFNGLRYWFEGDSIKSELNRLIQIPATSRKPDMADWFYIPLWLQSIAEKPKFTGSLNWLIFIGEKKFEIELLERLIENGQHTIKVKIGDRFTAKNDNSDFYTINPHHPGDYNALFKDLVESKQIPQKIIHMWSLTGKDIRRPGYEGIDEFLDTGFFSLLNIVQTSGRLNITDQIEIEVITDNLHKITGEELLFPEKATILGAAKIIPLEYPNIKCRSIDIVLPEPGTWLEDKLIYCLLGEFTFGFKDKYVAYRLDQRWIEIYKPYRLEEKDSVIHRFKENGIYMIIGGFGGMGFSIAEYLAKVFKARLILLGRSVFPSKKEWNQWIRTHNSQNDITKKIKTIQEWESLGAEIMVFSADVSSLEQMRYVIGRVNREFGHIDGVIHAAGVVDFGGAIQKRTREITDSYMASKIKGTLVLERLCENSSFDFLALFSSIGNVLYSGKFGQVSYNAANEFLEAFSNYKSFTHDAVTITINWCDWKEVGMSVKTIEKRYEGNSEKPDFESIFYDALSPTEGVDVFKRIMANELPRVTVSTIDLNNKLDKQKNDMEKSGNNEIEDVEGAKNSRETNLFQRPELSTPYVTPKTQTEIILVDIFQRLSGIQNVGINDDFFELGGDSLKAMSVIAHIKKKLSVQIPLAAFFNTPTIAQMAYYIDNTQKGNFLSIKPTEKKEYYVLSSAQKRLYFLQQMDNVGTAYNISASCVLEGVLNRNKLEHTFVQFVKRHEGFRTSFVIIDEETVQRIHDNVEFKIERLGTGEQEGVKEKRRGDPEWSPDKGEELQIVMNFIRPFDLSKAPLLRIGLVKEKGDRHILMMDMHHIISDGTSMNILVKDFMALYQGKQLPELLLQYKDFSNWQKDEKQAESLKRQSEYWLNEFAGEIPVLNLPLDYPRPVVQRFEGNQIPFEIDKESTVILKALTLKTEATLYMLLLALYTVFLSKITGQEDIIIGSPIAGRRHTDLAEIIGMFANTLVMRNYPTGDKTFSLFLQEVKEKTLKSFENQDYQYEDLVERVAISRDTSRNPLFDTMFVLQNIEIAEINIPGLKLSPYPYENKIAKFDLSLTAVEVKEKLLFNLEYCTKLFKEETINRFITYFKNVVNSIIENKERRIFDFEIITEEEKKQILVDFNDTEAEYPKDKTIHQLFEEQAERTPDNISLVGADEGEAKKRRREEEKKGGVETLRATSLPKPPTHLQITYSQLNEQSNQLAGLLIEKGVLPDNIVGIMMERSIEMIIGILGILKAGGAHMPIDPEYPEARIQYMLRESKAKILINKSEIQNSKFETNPNDQNKNQHFGTDSILNFENLNLSSIKGCPRGPSNFKPSNLAYIIYTSGTTGQPKGSLIEHRNIVRLMFNGKFQFDFSDRDVWTLFHSFCFDFSVWEMYGALLYGGKSVIIPKMIARNTVEFLELLMRETVTVLNQTPSAFYHLINECLNYHQKEKNLYLRYVIFGGETLSPSKLKEWREKFLKIKLINMFGVTETTVHVTYKEVTDAEIELRTSNIGKPIPTLSVYILDRYLRPVPMGMTGEICVGGKGVCRGYLNRVELTEEKFIKNPYKAGDRLYRSGDVGRFLIDGDIEYLGRIDHQVKIRGFRIELGEIENQLLSYDGIKDAVVLADGTIGERYLCAYIVYRKEITITDLRAHLSGKLPEYMIPSYFVDMEKLPLTPNGKLDCKALPKPVMKIENDGRPPRNDIEKKLVEIWSAVLGIEKEKIGIDSNFFEIGGHSLKTTIVAARIHKLLNLRISLADVFKNPTIRGLSGILKEFNKDKFVSIELSEKKEYYILSYAQKRIYIALQLESDSTSYNMPFILRLSGELDQERLQESFQMLIERHESLRTSFEIIGDEPVQRLHDKVEFSLQCLDQGERILELRKYIRSFDLTRAPLLRVYLLRIGDREYGMMMDISHLISDGVSSMMMAKDLMKLYNGQELPHLNIQYKDFSEWESYLFRTGNIKKQEDFWLNEFKSELPLLELPTDFHRPDMRNVDAGEIITTILGESSLQKLNDIIQETGSTLFTMLLAIYNVLLNKYSGQEDIVVGSVVTGRTHEDLENVMGVFINMLPLRNRPQPGKNFREFLEEVKENALYAFENQDYPVEELVKKLKIRNKPGRHPLFDTEFAVNNIGFEEIAIPGLKMEYYDSGLNFAKFDLHFLAIERNHTLEIILRYSTELFKKNTAEKIIQHFVEIIGQVIETPSIKLADIEISMDFMPIKSSKSAKEKDDFNF